MTHRRSAPSPCFPCFYSFIQQTLPRACAVMGDSLSKQCKGSRGQWQSHVMRAGAAGRRQGSLAGHCRDRQAGGGVLTPELGGAG